MYNYPPPLMLSLKPRSSTPVRWLFFHGFPVGDSKHEKKQGRNNEKEDALNLARNA